MVATRMATVWRRAVWTTGRRFLVSMDGPMRPLGIRGVATAPPRRAFSHVTFTFVDRDGTSTTTVTAHEGQSLLDVAHEHDVELEGACGGELACSTCHVVLEKRILDQLPAMSEEEQDMLDLAWGLTDTSRLGCQIAATKAMEGMTVQIPDDADNLM